MVHNQNYMWVPQGRIQMVWNFLSTTKMLCIRGFWKCKTLYHEIKKPLGKWQIWNNKFKIGQNIVFLLWIIPERILFNPFSLVSLGRYESQFSNGTNQNWNRKKLYMDIRKDWKKTYPYINGGDPSSVTSLQSCICVTGVWWKQIDNARF